MTVDLKVISEWGISINSNEFVLYDSGLAIFRRRTRNHISEFFSAQLSPKEVAGLLKQLAPNGLSELAPDYELSHASDLPLTILEILDTQTKALHKTTVYAYFDGGVEPAAFVRAYRVLTSYKNSNEHPWFPTSIYISVSPATDHDPTPAYCVWPNAWENLTSTGSSIPQPSSTQTKSGPLGTILAKGTRLTEIQKLLQACDMQVMLDGRLVYMTPIIRLPHEALPTPD